MNKPCNPPCTSKNARRALAKKQAKLTRKDDAEARVVARIGPRKHLLKYPDRPRVPR